MTTPRTKFTFEDLAGRSGVTRGRARYAADHGDRRAAHVLAQVDAAYAELGREIDTASRDTEPGATQ